MKREAPIADVNVGHTVKYRHPFNSPCPGLPGGAGT